MYIIMLKDDNTIINKSMDEITEFSNAGDPIVNGVCYPLNLINCIEIDDIYDEIIIPYECIYDGENIIKIEPPVEENIEQEEIIEDEY